MAIETKPEPDVEHPQLARLRPSASVLGVALGAAVGSVYFVGAGRSLDYDGSVTVGAFVRTGGLFDVFRNTYLFNNHPYFSFLEHLMWSAGGRSEAWLRVIPIVCAAATVGIFTVWAARRWGATAGFIGGIVLAANPMFADLSRSVRGYSLMVLGCTVATIVFVDSERRSSAMTRRHSALYAVALGVAIGTQFYAVLVLLAHLGTLISRRQFDSAWRRRIEITVAIGVLPYAAMVRPLFDSARSRRGTFQPGFPVDAARELLGHQYLAVVALAALTIYALSTAAVRRPLHPAMAVIAISLLAVWIALHPLDLYPRFLVWLVPAVALAVASTISRRPMRAPLAIVAVFAMVLSQASSWTTDPIASRQTARLVETARADHQTPCAVGYSTELILGYTRRVRSVFTVQQLAGCALLFTDADPGTPEIRDMACHYAHEERLRGRTTVVVFTQPKRIPASADCLT